MPIILFFFLCLIAAFAGLVLKWRGVRTAYIWMMLVFISFILWLLILVIKKDSFFPFIINNWFSFNNNNISLRFVVNDQNWILVISLLTINLTFFLTGIARLDVKSDLNNWVFQLILIAFSFLALLSADLWSVVLAWTVLDLLELAYNRLILKDIGGNYFFRKFIIKFLGSMVLIWNIAALSKSGINPLLSGIVSSSSSASIFLAAFMHSGILPFKNEITATSEKPNRDLLRSAFSLISFIVSFSLVLYLPLPKIPFLLSFSLSVFSYFLMLISWSYWAFINEEIGFSLKYLLMGETGVFIILYLSGAAQYLTFILALNALLVIWLVLFTHRAKNLKVFAVLGTFFISGLPFSLIAFGPRTFVGNEISLGMIILIISLTLFMIGFLRNAFAANEKFGELEVWYQAAYLAGLFIPFLSAAAIIFHSKPSFASEIQFWWIGVAVAVIALISYLLTGRKKDHNISLGNSFKSRVTWFWKFLSFEWLFKGLAFLEGKIKGSLNSFSGMIEGEGGILWAFVILLLILTLFRQ